MSATIIEALNVKLASLRATTNGLRVERDQINKVADECTQVERELVSARLLANLENRHPSLVPHVYAMLTALVPMELRTDTKLVPFDLHGKSNLSQEVLNLLNFQEDVYVYVSFFCLHSLTCTCVKK